MILNNYRAIRHVRTLKDQPLTPDTVIELQRRLTVNTLDEPKEAGRLRREDEPIEIRDARDGTLLHVPPAASELGGRLSDLCHFANGVTPSFYIHPVVRSILIHFWLGYDHPFVDGNGRTARALFYWSMLRQGYWLCEYLSISSVVKAGPAKYMRAYLYSESDNNDTTYFVLYHLQVIKRAIQALHQYLRVKMHQIRQTERLLQRRDNINHRQLALLGHALRHPNMVYTIQSHKESHSVAYQTARTDLLALADQGLLTIMKRGRQFNFIAPPDLGEKLG
jgi:Fic family protein